MKTRGSGGRPAAGTAFEAWLATVKRLCRLGGFATKTEGFRVHFKLAHFDQMKAFTLQEWIAWPVGQRCCRLAPACAEESFWEDRKHMESRIGYDTAGSVCGDVPVAIRFLSRGRLNLPEQVTEPTHILKNDRVYVMPRLSGAIEVWNYAQWLKATAKADSADGPG